MSCRGLAERGRPPFLMTARASISSVSSGSSLYSTGLTTCASTRARSEPKVRREAGLLTFVCLSHAEDVANRATRGVADHYEPAAEQTKAEDSVFTIVLALVLDLDRDAVEDSIGVLEVQTPLSQRALALGRIVCYAHVVIVSTRTGHCKLWTFTRRMPEAEQQCGPLRNFATGGQPRCMATECRRASKTRASSVRCTPHCRPSGSRSRASPLGRQRALSKQTSIPKTGRSDRTARQRTFATGGGNRP